ncbi:MAG: UDP-N-acetylenolpyruvoylglucosamine reductase [Hydrogenophilales bacterium 28-61-23]|nr:MAG: UDP-N-acetylenolpyruvoylglucosamine reductase [Hydrogenophilales bacterium 28-61-23]
MIVAEYLDPPRKVPGTQGELLLNADMSCYTSWRAGGKADRLYTPVDLADLCAFLKTLDKDEPVHFIGLGSNLLVRDGGLRGTVIHLHGALRRIDLEQRRTNNPHARNNSSLPPEGAQCPPWDGPAADSNGSDAASPFGVIYAEAGVASPKVARFAASQNLVGAEFLAGIPGTVGGALAMNAGCYGHETWEFVTQVLTVDRLGQIHRRSPKEYRVSYRHVEPGEEIVRQEWFVGAWFTFPRGDGEKARVDIKQLLEKRIASQPLSLPNAGSIFRNPPGDFAARLIEACTLKGEKRGGAQISEKHANFIVNLGGASAADIEHLIDKIQAQVEAKFGIKLVREVRIVGEKL